MTKWCWKLETEKGYGNVSACSMQWSQGGIPDFLKKIVLVKRNVWGNLLLSEV
jgi:hypothetical protein